MLSIGSAFPPQFYFRVLRCNFTDHGALCMAHNQRKRRGGSLFDLPSKGQGTKKEQQNSVGRFIVAYGALGQGTLKRQGHAGGPEM